MNVTELYRRMGIWGNLRDTAEEEMCRKAGIPLGRGTFMHETMSQVMEIIRGKHILEEFAVSPKKSPYYTCGAGAVPANLSSVLFKLGIHLEKPKGKRTRKKIKPDISCHWC